MGTVQIRFQTKFARQDWQQWKVIQSVILKNALETQTCSQLNLCVYFLNYECITSFSCCQFDWNKMRGCSCSPHIKGQMVWIKLWVIFSFRGGIWFQLLGSILLCPVITKTFKPATDARPVWFTKTDSTGWLKVHQSCHRQWICSLVNDT